MTQGTDTRKTPTLLVGITGGIGSGKSAVTRRFAEHGIVIVDADEVARQVVEPGSPALAAIAEHFGGQILTTDGHLDRRALRDIVFRQPEEKRWLETLLHPLIRQENERQLRTSRSLYTILVSPLLLETGQDALVDRVLVVDVPETLQVSRTMARDTTDEEGVRAIMAAQMNRTDRLARADDVIVNDGSMEHLHEAVDRQHARYCQLATAGP